MNTDYLFDCLTRAGLVVAALVIWHWTQRLIAARDTPEGSIGDWVHRKTDGIHAWLTGHPAAANQLLIVSSLAIDVCGLTILAAAIFGPTMEPFVALVMVFLMRQICQGLCALPVPPGMIWRDPGFPSLLVTYGVGNDLFFSGHTALVTLSAIEAWHHGPPWLAAIAGAHAIAQAVFVLLLRAHYTLDVLAGIWAAWFAADLARMAMGWFAG